MFTEGQPVTIKVLNPLWHTRHRGALNAVGHEFNTYTGAIIRQKWFKPNEIGITTGDKNFPFRVINVERIVQVGDAPVDYTPTKTKTDTITKTVQGSKGATYIVTKNGSNVHCTCPGHSFRKTCKHVEEI